jgi:hypothetical protein
MRAVAKPFDLTDFKAQAQASPPHPAPDDEARLAAARAEGVLEGRRLAMETIAADEAASLARIAAAIEDTKAQVAEARARDQAAMLSAASEFFEAFSEGLAEHREVEAALDLLRRLTQQSDDRRLALLVVSSHSRDRLAPKIEAALKAKRLHEFVSLESDSSLAPGEMRLQWRGGDVRRTRQEIREAAAALVRSLPSAREHQQ